MDPNASNSLRHRTETATLHHAPLRGRAPTPSLFAVAIGAAALIGCSSSSAPPERHATQSSADETCWAWTSAPIQHGDPPPTLSGTTVFTSVYSCSETPQTAVVWYGQPDSGDYSYDGLPWYDYSEWPPPPFAPWPGGFKGPIVFPLSYVDSGIASFDFDTTQLPGTSQDTVPYDIHVALGDANGNIIADIPHDCSDNPTGDCDITVYVANDEGGPPNIATDCNPTINSPFQDQVMSGTEFSISATSNCNGPIAAVYFSMGPAGGSTESGNAILDANGNGSIDTTTQPDGDYQASAIACADPSCATTIGSWAPLVYESISNGGGGSSPESRAPTSFIPRSSRQRHTRLP